MVSASVFFGVCEASLLFGKFWFEYIYIFNHCNFHRMSELLEADEHLMEFMKTQVRERKAVIGSTTAPSEREAGTIQADAFTMLVKANEDEGGKLKLDDEELVRWTLLSISFFFFLLWKLYSTCDADRQYLHYVVCWSW